MGTRFHHGPVLGVGSSRGGREQGDGRTGGGTHPKGSVARKDGGGHTHARRHGPEGKAGTRVAGHGDCVAA